MLTCITKFMSAMCPEQKAPMSRSVSVPSRQSGFAIIAAIFLIVVLAALGTFMVTFSTVQQTTAAADLQGTRAYHAAKVGIEWGAYQALRNGACPASTTLSPGGTLSGFSVAVLCTAYATTEAGNNVTLTQITSTASQGAFGTPTYTERQLKATVGK